MDVPHSLLRTRKVPDLFNFICAAACHNLCNLGFIDYFVYLKCKFGASNFSSFDRVDSKYSEAGSCGYQYGLVGRRDAGLVEIF